MDEEIRRLYLMRKTSLQMLRDRGYSVVDSEINITKTQFIEKFGVNIRKDDLVILKEKKDNPSDKIYVFFVDGEKVGVSVIKSLIARLKMEDVLRAILVLKALSPQAKSAIKAVSPRFRMEVFEEPEMVVNITEHELVPKHTVLTDDEKKELLKTYMITETQLPRILVSDPVARYYGLTRGQVVKITRDSVTASEFVTYRYAV